MNQPLVNATAVAVLLLGTLLAALSTPAAAAGPQFSGTIPSLGIYAGTQNLTAYDVSPLFTDADGDAMTFMPNFIGGPMPNVAAIPNFTVTFSGSIMELRSTNAADYGIQYLMIRAEDVGSSFGLSNVFAIHIGPTAAPAAREWTSLSYASSSLDTYAQGCTTGQTHWTSWFYADARITEFSAELGHKVIPGGSDPNGTGGPPPAATSARVVWTLGSTEILNRSLPDPGERVYMDTAAITASLPGNSLFGISEVRIEVTVCAWDGQTYYTLGNPRINAVRLPTGDAGADLDATAPAFVGGLPDIQLAPGGSRMGAFNLSGTYVSDADGDPIEYTVHIATGPGYVDGAITFELEGGVMGFRMMDPNWTGELTLYITGRDPAGRFARSNNFTVNVSWVDRAPVFSSSLANFSVALNGTRGGVFDAADHFDDPDGLALTFSIVNQSASEGWNYTTLSWDGTMLNVTNDGSSGWTGTLCFSVRATDVNNSTADSNEVCFDVTPPANSPPAPTQALPGLSAPAGDNGHFLIDLTAYFTDDGPSADLNYAVVMGSEAGWQNVRVIVRGTLLAAEFLGPTPPSALTFLVTVSDARGGSFTTPPVALTIEARPGNHAPTLTGPATATLELGSVNDLTLAAADQDGDTLAFTVVSSDPKLLASFDASTGLLSISGTGMDEAATYQVGISAADGWGASFGIIVDVRVWNSANLPQLSVHLESTPGADVWVNGTVAVGPQPDGAPALSAIIQIDGGTLLPAPVIGGNFALRVAGPLAVGEHAVAVRVTDGYGRAGVASGFVTIAAPPSPSPTPQPGPTPLPTVPDLLAIEPVGQVSTYEEGLPLGFTVTLSAPLPAGVTVSWYLDDVLVGDGTAVSGLLPAPGHHTLTARASNGEVVESVTLGFDVDARATPPPSSPGSGGISILWLLVAAGAAIVGTTLVRTETGRYLLLAALFGSVFSKLKKPSLLDHFVRGALYQEIRREPGLHFEELRRRTGLANGQASYHLRTLEQGGYIRAVVQGTHTRFFTTDRKLDPAEYGVSANDRKVLEAVEEKPGITQRDLSDRLGRSSSSVSRSVSRLTILGYIVTERKDRGVAVFPRAGEDAVAARSPRWPDEGV